MPIVNWNTKADFDTWYSFGAEPDGHPNTRAEIRLNNHKAVRYNQSVVPRAKHLIANFGWDINTQVFILGCGFGWLMEALSAEGLNALSLKGSDTSPYIQAEKNNTEEADINNAISAVGLNSASGEGLTHKNRLYDGKARSNISLGFVINDWDVSQNGDRAKIRNAFSGGFHVVTESVLESLTDQECIDISADIHAIHAADVLSVIHIVQIAGQVDPTFNSKTLTEWKTLLPNDIFMQDGTGVYV